MEFGNPASSQNSFISVDNVVGSIIVYAEAACAAVPDPHSFGLRIRIRILLVPESGSECFLALESESEFLVP